MKSLYHTPIVYVLLYVRNLVNWLAHEKTLREQGVDESQTLVLRYYSYVLFLFK